MTSSPIRTGSFVSLRVDVGNDTNLDSSMAEEVTEGSSDSAVVCSADSIESPHDIIKEVKLDSWDATSLCGCGGIAAVFYSVAFCMAEAGTYAPFILAFCFIISYCLISFLLDILSALPVNGGSYNALTVLNGASAAIFFAGMNIAVYVSMGVTAARYSILILRNFLGYPAWMTQLPFSLTLVTVVGMWNTFGAQPSGRATFFLTTFHVLVLAVFLLSSTIFAFQGVQASHDEDSVDHRTIFNWNVDESSLTFNAIYHGFVASFIGMSGIIDIAEQPELHVFTYTARKALTRTFAFISLSTLSVSVLAVYLVRFDMVSLYRDEGTLLLVMAGRTGSWLEKLVGFDGAILMIGSILTSYTAFNSMVSRMATDGKMPAILGTANNMGGRPWATVLYWGLVVSVLLVFEVVDGESLGLQLLALVGMVFGYVISEVALKRLSNELQLPRDKNPPSWMCVVFVGVVVCLGLGGAVERSTCVTAVALLSLLAVCLVLSVCTLWSNGKLTTCCRPLKWSTVSKAETMHHTQLATRRNTILTFQPTISPSQDEESMSETPEPTPKWSPPPSPIEKV